MSGLTEFSKTYKPFAYPWAMAATEEHENFHWHEGEASIQDDVGDWQRLLSPSEKNLIHQILRLFTQSDVNVGGNYAEHYIPYFKNNEIRNMLLSFAAREGVHQRAYALLNDTINLPESDYRAFLDYEEMSDKMDYMVEMDMSSPFSVGLALAKTIFNEGVSLFGAFTMLLNFQRFGKMKGMCEVVRWSIRDESMHVQGMLKLFKQFLKEHPEIVDDTFKRCIYDMARSIYLLEERFIDLAFEMGEVQGLDKEDVKQHIRYLCDRRLEQLGLKPNFHEETTPLPWFDELMGGTVFANFFEGKVTDYQVVSMTGEWGDCYGSMS